MEPELFEQLLHSLGEADIIRLSNEAREQLEEILDNPPEATEKLKELMRGDEN